jgi:ribosomal protein S27AE
MKDNQSIAKEWQEVSAEVTAGMAEWRRQHPRATLREIEQELDKRLAPLRARMLEDTALLSEKREWDEGEAGEPTCPECGLALKGRTREERQLQTQGEEIIRLERQYGVCPKCGQGFFPPR